MLGYLFFESFFLRHADDSNSKNKHWFCSVQKFRDVTTAKLSDTLTRFCPPSQKSQLTFSRGYVPEVNSYSKWITQNFWPLFITIWSICIPKKLRIINLNEQKNHVPELWFEPTSPQITQNQGKLDLNTLTKSFRIKSTFDKQ